MAELRMITSDLKGIGTPEQAGRSLTRAPKPVGRPHATDLVYNARALQGLSTQMRVAVSALERMMGQRTNALEERLASVELLLASSARSHIRTATEAERTRWNDYLASLVEQSTVGTLARTQVRTALDFWQRAIEREPNTMYPTAGTTADGDLYFSWRTDARTLVVEIDSAGRFSWFHQAKGCPAEGTESDENESNLPLQFYAVLATLRRA